MSRVNKAHRSALPPQPGWKTALARGVGAGKRLYARYKPVARGGLLVLIAAFLALALWKSWSSLSSYSWHVSWPLLVVAFVFFAAQEVSFTLIWRAILAHMGDRRLDPISAARIYLSAEAVRYIPGNVWHVITRVVLAEREGVPKALGFASMVVELATKIASGVLVFVATLLFWPDARAFAAQIPHAALVTMGVLGTPLLLLGLHPRLLEWGLSQATRLLKRDPVRLGLGYGDVLAITGLWALSWLASGIGLYLLVRSLGFDSTGLGTLLEVTGIYALGWVVGFLSFVTPSGLGFREVAIAGLLVAAGVVPTFALGTVVALLARLVSTAAEVGCILGAQAVASGRDRLDLSALAALGARSGGHTPHGLSSADRSAQRSAQRPAVEGATSAQSGSAQEPPVE